MRGICHLKNKGNDIKFFQMILIYMSRSCPDSEAQNEYSLHIT